MNRKGKSATRVRDRFSICLMNDTKWREVWELVASLRLRIHFAYAIDHAWNRSNSEKLHGPFPHTWVEERGIRDPGIGGPFRYEEILWIRVPRIPRNDTETFCRRLDTLGQLPIRVEPDFVEIRGYHDSTTADR
jgi:hypothetical protein